MTNAPRIDEKSRMRQFWLRVLLALGMLWGGMPFVTLPLIFIGVISTPFSLFAAVLNGLTVAPACVLAFWHQRVACIWLSVNAAVAAVAVTFAVERTRQFYFEATIGMAGSVLITLCLDFMEIGHWPGALER